MKETVIESKIREYAISKGCTFEKFVTPGARGANDRLVTSPCGVMGKLEIKKIDGKVHPKQQRIHDKQKARGVPCAIVWSIEEGRAFIDDLLTLQLYKDEREPVMTCDVCATLEELDSRAPKNYWAWAEAIVELFQR